MLGFGNLLRGQNFLPTTPILTSTKWRGFFILDASRSLPLIAMKADSDSTVVAVVGSLTSVDPDMINLKRIILTGVTPNGLKLPCNIYFIIQRMLDGLSLSSFGLSVVVVGVLRSLLAHMICAGTIGLPKRTTTNPFTLRARTILKAKGVDQNPCS